MNKRLAWRGFLFGIVLAGFAMAGCLGMNPVVTRGPGDGLAPCGARLCRDGKAFSGFVIENYPSGKIRWKREYHHGLKDGIHTGWWENGQKMFVYEFEKDLYSGSFREWYADGKPAKDMHYVKSVEVGLQRAWRPNGTLYTNYEARDGRQYGVVNSRLCYSVKDGKGVYSVGH